MIVVIVDEQIQLMMKHNEELPDIEKLSRHEFDLDIDEQTRLQAEGEAEVERVSGAQCSDGWNAACEGGVLNWIVKMAVRHCHSVFTVRGCSTWTDE